MNVFSKLAVAGILLGGATGYVQAQTAQPEPVQTTQDAQTADNDDMMGFGHGRHHGERHGMGEHRGETRGEGRGGRMMQMNDANGDGFIGEEEAAAMADHAFIRLDQNQDGTLDKSEFATPRHRGGGWRAWFGLGADEAAAVQKVREEKFATLDADKDGKLTKAEFFAEAKAKLAAADTDKDGKVSPWEFRAAK